MRSTTHLPVPEPEFITNVPLVKCDEGRVTGCVVSKQSPGAGNSARRTTSMAGPTWELASAEDFWQAVEHWQRKHRFEQDS
jgi:hypothetical protein